ncbi:MAG: hypothetical protein Fur0018_14960 [Anaerolineales bacterium]
MPVSRRSPPPKPAPVLMLLFGLVGLLTLGATPNPANHVVRVGIYQNMPLYGLDDENKPQGLYVDILTAIARQENWELSWQPCHFDDCLILLENHQIDLLGAIAYSPERAEHFDFSQEPVLTNWGQVYTPPGNKIEAWPNLNGRRVALLKQDIHASAFKDLANKFDIHPLYIHVDTYDEVFAALNSGQAEAGVVNRIYGETHTRAYNLRASPIIFNPIEIMFAFPKGENQALRERVDADLRQMKTSPDSAYQDALERWLGATPVLTIPPWLLWGLMLALAGLLIFFATSIWLRHRLQGQIVALDLQNKRLQAEIQRHQQTQQTLRLHTAALESAPDAITITDSNGIIQWVNPAYTRMTGYEGHECLGKPDPSLGGGLEHELRDRANSGETWHSEVIATHKDGHHYRVKVTVTPIQNQGEGEGETRHIIIQEDVTERKQREHLESVRLLIAEALVGDLLPEEMHQRILTLMKEIFDVSCVALGNTQAGKELILAASGTWQAYIQSPPPDSWPRPPDAQLVILGRNTDRDTTTHTPYLAALSLPVEQQSLWYIWLGGRVPFQPEDARTLEEIQSTLTMALQRARLFASLHQQLQRINTLHSISMAIASSVDKNLSLNILSEQLSAHAPVDALAIYTYDPQRNYLQIVQSRNLPEELRMREYRQLMTPYITTAMRKREPLIIPDLREVTQPREQILLGLHQTYHGYACFPLITKGRINGALELYAIKPYKSNAEWIEFVRILSSQAALAIENAALFNEVISSKDQLTVAYESALIGWSRTLAIRHHEPLDHAERVADLCLQVAEAMGMNDDQSFRSLRYGAWMHDVGKLGLPEDLLYKQEASATEKMELCKTTPILAQRFLADIPYLEDAATIPLYRYERWDGKGHPYGLSGENIPLIARIFSAVHFWDARSESRHYVSAMSAGERAAYLRANSGTRFDPQVVTTLLNMMGY